MLPPEAGGVGDVLPISLSRFFGSYYDQRMLRLNHTDTAFDPAALWSVSELRATLATMASDGALSEVKVASYPKNHGPKGKVGTPSSTPV